MSYPILYSATETNFDNNGIGILSACVSCEVTEEANGLFELAMQYPMDGIHFDHIQSRSVVKAKPDQFREPQLFRVYNISKPNINGIVSVFAQHISYDLSGISVAPFTAEGLVAALSGLKSNAVTDCPFEFWTDKNTSGKFTVPYPASIRSRLGGVQGSILDAYTGEYEFDNFTVKLHNNRGADRGVSIRYGKNLLSLKQEENCHNIATGIYPYWLNQETGEIVQLPEKIVDAQGEYGFTKIRTVDFTSYFQEQPTEGQLRTAAERYIQNNEIGVPIVSLDVSFAQLQKSDEYKHLKMLERVSLFDTLSVEFPALKVSARAKAVKVVYNVLQDRVESVTLGSVRANIADTIVEQQKQIQQVPTKTDLQLAKEAATAWLTNGKGYAYFRKDGLGNIVDILFMDTQDAETAVNVMRVGQSGIGFSHNGVNGPYESAWTIDGKFVADFIATGTILATLIKAGILQSKDGKTFFLDLDNGILKMQATEFSVSGKTVDEIAQEKADTAEDNAVGRAVDIAQNAVDAQTQMDIFNKLTNNGLDQGIYIKDGKLYLNASYMMAGTLDAAMIAVKNLIAEKVISKDGENILQVDGGEIKLLTENLWNVLLCNAFSGRPILYIRNTDDGTVGDLSELSATHLKLGGTSTVPLFYVSTTGGATKLWLNGEMNGKTLAWKDNGDGTFSLIGQ